MMPKDPNIQTTGRERDTFMPISTPIDGFAFLESLFPPDSSISERRAYLLSLLQMGLQPENKVTKRGTTRKRRSKPPVEPPARQCVERDLQDRHHLRERRIRARLS
jgi:hypothetical protein